MDELLACAKAFESLLNVRYHIIIGRKGKINKLNIQFESIEFHHLIGLHKLHDLRLSRANRQHIFHKILSGEITLDDIQKSQYFYSIHKRLKPFQKIESIFDKNDLVFLYNKKLTSFSHIEAKYLLSTPFEYEDIYIFLDRKDNLDDFFCRSFFPKESIDYTKGQAAYTLLKKEKTNTLTGLRQLQYDRLSPKKETMLSLHIL